MQKIILVIVCLCGVMMAKAQPHINRAEYFLNTHRGFGNGTTITLTPGADITNVSFTANLAGLTEGINSLYIRSRDANGKWSVTNRFLFIKGNPAAALPNINRVEYFINTDPGFGSGKSIPITAASDITDATGAIDLTGVPEGINSLYIRSRDIYGKWSVSNRFLFVHSLVPVVNSVTNAEYFFDNDPGFGQATAIPVTAGVDVADASVNANIGPLSLGMHSLFIRSRDAAGKWSVTNRFLFVKAAADTGVANITGVEYFIDNDPGCGNANPVPLNPATNVPDFIMNVNITGLATGTHRLYLRSRNAAGNWSITNTYSFTLNAAAPAPLIAVNSMTQKTLCGANKFVLAYHSTGTYNNGNVFSVQLSNATGSFTSPQVIGTLASTASGLVNCTIPLSIPNGTGYRVRVVSSSPAVTGLTSDTLLRLYAQPSFSDTTVVIVCSGATANLANVFTTTGFTTAWNAPNVTSAPLGTYQLIAANAAAAFCRDTTQVLVQHEVATWLGTVSNNWHVAANWSTGKVPGAKTHVIVSGGTPFPCVISTANAEAASVRTINSGRLQTNTNRALNITERCALPLPQ